MLFSNPPLLVEPSRTRNDAFLLKLGVQLEIKACTYGFNVPALAQFLGMSVTQLKRKTRMYLNTSPGRLILRHRMRKAAHLLRTRHLSIKQIAYASGYQEPAFFSSAFKAYYQYTPTEYRSRFNTVQQPGQLDWELPLTPTRLQQIIRLGKQLPWVKELLLFALEHLEQNGASMQGLAVRTFLSPAQLNRKANRMFGISPGRIVRELRLCHAADLLCSTDETVTSIAYDLNFVDAAHFCHRFETAFGQSPTSYRKTKEATGWVGIQQKLEAAFRSSDVDNDLAAAKARGTQIMSRRST
ncbi:MAG: helix-turn-helix domain-containing protein [Salibacteraceae bacterium]